jgi:carboxymethylenebutenolidase
MRKFSALRMGALAILVMSLPLSWNIGSGDQSLLPSSSKLAALLQTDEKLPPAEEHAKARLDKSPRHGEYVDIKVEGSEYPIKTWVVYPERKDKAPVLIVIHEIFGLSDWIRAVADQLAADGFIAVAPDLISGKGPGGGGTDSLPPRDEVVKLIRSLVPEEVTTRLNAVRAYAVKLSASAGAGRAALLTPLPNPR